MKYSVLIIEDEPAIAHEIAFNVTDRGFNVAAVIHNSDKAIDFLHSHHPDVVLLDIRLEGSKSGIEIGELINTKYKIPFIYLTSYADQDTIEKASATLPYGYIVKPFKDEDIAPAIHMALAQSKKEKQLGLPSLNSLNKGKANYITEAEYRIIEEIWKGKSNLEIADTLCLSVNTIKTHIQNIYSKMQVGSKSKLMSTLRSMS